MNETVIGNSNIKSLTWGMHDAVANGEIVRDIPSRLIFVANVTERDGLTDLLPGTFVATYGCTNVWQLNGNNEWATIK